MAWINCKDKLPNDFTIVKTKIDDEHGIRNEQYLKKCGNLWFIPNGSIYVYYSPTHWMEDTKTV